MAKQEYDDRASFVLEATRRGLQIITTPYDEDFAHGTYKGSEGNFGCGVRTEGDGCPPGYSAVLYDTAAEFEDYAYSDEGFAMPPRGY
jgi:hypothetical protein